MSAFEHLNPELNLSSTLRGSHMPSLCTSQLVPFHLSFLTPKSALSPGLRKNFFVLLLGPHQAMLRASPWFWAQGSFHVQLLASTDLSPRPHFPYLKSPTPFLWGAISVPDSFQVGIAWGLTASFLFLGLLECLD